MNIFYHPDTLKIMGASDSEVSMDYPYVETDNTYHSLGNLGIKKKGKKVELVVARGTYNESIYNK
jgi:hypothetical protein